MQLTAPECGGSRRIPTTPRGCCVGPSSWGVNFIDTADSYGPFASEQLIRKALHPYPQGLVIATKGGLSRSGPDDCGAPR